MAAKYIVPPHFVHSHGKPKQAGNNKESTTISLNAPSWSHSVHMQPISRRCLVSPACWLYRPPQILFLAKPQKQQALALHHSHAEQVLRRDSWRGRDFPQKVCERQNLVAQQFCCVLWLRTLAICSDLPRAADLIILDNMRHHSEVLQCAKSGFDSVSYHVYPSILDIYLMEKGD